MTVLENVLVGRHTRTKEGSGPRSCAAPASARAEAEPRERAMELLEFIGLAAKRDHLARNLPYGEQRKLEIARALASDPGLLLLDEPTAGMNPQETRATENSSSPSATRASPSSSSSTTCASSSTSATASPCLVQGEKLVEGTPEVVQGDERVIAAYLGTGDEDDAGASAS